MCLYCKKNDNKLLCDNCYNKYPINLKLEYIPLDEFKCFILSLFKKKNKINTPLYIDELSFIFNFFNNKGYHIIYKEQFNFNMDNILVVDAITKLIKEDVLIMTDCVND